MKCTFCTYDYTPDNFPMLKAHAEKDILEGITRGIIPVVVWRDGTFILVKEAESNDRVFDIDIVDPRPVFDGNLVVETFPEEEQEEE